MIKKERLINTLLDLVRIDSPSGEEEILAKEIAQRLIRLGAIVEFDNFGNLLARFDGTGQPIMFNAHLDTVEPGRGVKPIINQETISSDGTTILGGDAKAGIAAILEALTSLKEGQRNHLPVEVVLTRQEELGLTGATNLDYQKIRAKTGFVFDGDEQVHKLYVSSPGYILLDANITGRSAHAGVEPEKGISAIKIAANILSKLPLGRIDHETTLNIGLIEGGTVRNAVPDKTVIKGELRSRSKQKLKQLTSQVKQIFCSELKKHKEARLELTLIKAFDSFYSNLDKPAIQMAVKTLKSLGLKADFIDSGGGTDANFFHKNGIDVAVVGTGVWESHTTREYVVIPELIQTAEFAEKIIAI